jgi:hypothetical protein
MSLDHNKQREPSLTDLLQDVELLGEGHDMFDETTASQALLSAAWRLIWEYRQMCSISRGHASSWSNSNLLLSSRLTELTKLLDCVKMSSHANVAMTLSLELLLMHLHISLEEMHLFAGAEGHSEARRVFPLLQEWAKSSSARQGIYHAAQIVAAARKIPTGCLRDFHAIVLYQVGCISHYSYEHHANYITGRSSVMVLWRNLQRRPHRNSPRLNRQRKTRRKHRTARRNRQQWCAKVYQSQQRTSCHQKDCRRSKRFLCSALRSWYCDGCAYGRVQDEWKAVEVGAALGGEFVGAYGGVEDCGA